MIYEVDTATANSLVAQKTVEQFAPLQGDVSGSVNDEQILQLWLGNYTNPNTREQYEAAARRMLAALPGCLRTTTVAHWQAYRAALEARMAKSSANTQTGACASLFGFCERSGYIRRSPAHVHRKRSAAATRRLQRSISEEHIARLIKGGKLERDRVMIEFMFAAGARAVEIGRGWNVHTEEIDNSLTWAQVAMQPDGHALVTLRGKRGKLRTVKLAKGMSRRLMALRPEDFTDQDSVFCGSIELHERPRRGLHYNRILNIVKDARANARLPRHVTPHMLRHSHATVADRKGKSVTEIRDSLGHSNIQTTMGYIAEHDGVMIGDVFATETGETE